MSNKFLIGIGTAFFFVFVLGIAAVVGINTMSEQTTVINDVATTKPAGPALSASPSLAPEVQSQGQPVPVEKTAVSPQTLSPATPVPVLDSDLAQLAAAVKLGGSN